MSPRARLALAALIAALIAAVLAIGLAGQRLRGRELAAGAGRGSAVVALAPDEVVSLTVAAGAAEARLEREGARWRRAAPPGEADGAAVGELLDAAVALRRRVTLAGAGERRDPLDAYGLARPRARLELRLASGAAVALALGDQTGEDGAAFLRAPGGEVVVVAADAAERLRRALEALLPPPAGAPPAGGEAPAGVPARGG